MLMISSLFTNVLDSCATTTPVAEAITKVDGAAAKIDSSRLVLGECLSFVYLVGVGLQETVLASLFLRSRSNAIFAFKGELGAQ